MLSCGKVQAVFRQHHPVQLVSNIYQRYIIHSRTPTLRLEMEFQDSWSSQKGKYHIDQCPVNRSEEDSRCLHWQFDDIVSLPYFSCPDQTRKMCMNKAQDFSVMDPLMASATSIATKSYTKDDIRGLKEILPDLVRELTYDSPYNDVPSVNAHVAKVLHTR